MSTPNLDRRSILTGAALAGTRAATSLFTSGATAAEKLKTSLPKSGVIPFQAMFNDAVAAGTAANYWAGDGVHPSVAGHGLMAKTWIESIGL